MAHSGTGPRSDRLGREHEPPSATRPARLRAGTAAGLFAGLVMTVWKMAEASITGVGAWRPPNLISTIILGPAANTGSFVPVPFVVGMTLHLVTSIAMGLAYACVAPALRRPRAVVEVAAIIAYALLSWALYQYLIMPSLAPTMHENVSPVSLAVAHVVFGLAFAAWWIPSMARRR